jgi:transcriptional regulator with XRE-family HTH domain
MVLLRRVIGDALRARRQGQHRTLREVSTAANVSLGYLSEIERGQKEASSELLAAICEALGARLSEVLGEVSDTLSLAEDMDGVLVPVDGKPSPVKNAPVKSMATDGNVSVSVRQDSPLKATLRTTRKQQRDVVYAA